MTRFVFTFYVPFRYDMKVRSRCPRRQRGANNNRVVAFPDRTLVQILSLSRAAAAMCQPWSFLASLARSLANY